MARRTVCVIAQEPSKTIRLHQVVRSLRKFGYDAKILKPRFYPRFKPRTLSAAFRYFGIMLQVLFSKADVYYVFNNPDVGSPVVFKRGMLVYDVRAPWGAETYDLTGNRVVEKIFERIEYVLTRHADAVLTVNQKLAERAKMWGAKKVFVVPNYPVSSFKPTLSAKEMRDRHDLRGKKIALFTGNFAKVECAFDLVKLFPKVSQRIINAVLVMVGDGPQRPLVEQFVKKNGLERSIRLVGRIPRYDVANWLAIADVVVVPRRTGLHSSKYLYPEGIWKVNEALWLGKPIVVGAVGGFLHTKLSIRVAPLERFHEAIIDVLENPPKTKPLKDHNWDYSEKIVKEVLENLQVGNQKGRTEP